MPVRVVAHAARVVADVSQAEGRFDDACSMMPEPGVGIEAVARQQPPAVSSNEVDRVEDVGEDSLADEIVEVDPDPTRFDALAAARDLSLELVRCLEVDAEQSMAI